MLKIYCSCVGSGPKPQSAIAKGERKPCERLTGGWRCDGSIWHFMVLC